MNTPIARLFVVVLVLFAGLAGATSWWTVVRADSLDNDHPQQNQRALLRGLKVRRGVIRDRDGRLIARSVRDAHGDFQRTYPQGGLFGHPIGFSRAGLGQTTEVEAFRNQILATGRDTGVDSLLDQLTGKVRQGDDMITTLDSDAQRLAEQRIAAAGKEGSVVALDPRTGAVRVLASVPGYDPNTVTTSKALSRLNTDDVNRPLVDRALQFGEAPGSTMKLVTATAAIDTGRYTAQSEVDGRNDVVISGVPLKNDENESFGAIDLTTALAKSVNTAFAQVAVKLGKPTMKRYMERFGFDAQPRLDYPRDAMSRSGEKTAGGRFIPATSRFVDVGRLGIGQDKLSVTTMQMAQVAATIADGGKLMRPHLADHFVDTDGRTTLTIAPRVQSTVMQPSTAQAVKGMMEAVVERGTGTQGAIPGVKVAGKTGTAETQLGQRINDAWFVAFAPADTPKIAIAVNVQDVPGFGGAVAAPIARDVMALLLRKER